MKKITYYKWKEGFASSFLWDLNPTPFEDILENWDIDNGQLTPGHMKGSTFGTLYFVKKIHDLAT